MINQRNRFHGHASLKYVFNNGSQARASELSIKFARNSRRNHSRVAVVISKKVFKHAVDRNRVRRRVYEAMRFRINSFKEVSDVVVTVYNKAVRDIPYKQLESEIDKCLAKLSV